MKGSTILLLLFLPVFFVMVSCNSDNGRRPDPGAVANTKADPEQAKAVKEKLNGRWKSTEDENSIVLIAGNKLTSIYNNRVISEESLELFASCPEACSAGRNLSSSACFSARSQYNVSCYLIVTLEENKLEYSMIGGNGSTLSYERVVEE